LKSQSASVYIRTLTVLDGFGPGDAVVEFVVGRGRREGAVSQSDWNSHELDVALGVVPDEEFDAGPQLAACLVVDLAVGLNRHEVLLQRVAGAVDVRHPAAACPATVDEVTQPPVLKYLLTITEILKK